MITAVIKENEKQKQNDSLIKRELRKKNKSERKLRDRERMGEMKEEIFRKEK